MDKFEYGWAYVEVRSSQVKSKEGALPRIESNDLLNYLTRAGDDGWELVSTMSLSADQVMFFKRRKEPSEDEQFSEAETSPWTADTPDV